MSTLTPPLPGAPPDASAPPINLAAHYLTTYRRIFYSALLPTDVNGSSPPPKVQPFLLPFCLVGSFLLPIAYLCIPQYTVPAIQNQRVRIRREWVHKLRWIVGALIVWWNLGVVVGLPGFGGLGLGLTEGEGMGEGVEGGKGWVEKWFAPGKTTASACTAIAYAAGLMCGWGTIWGLEMVVFGGYQGWAMRVRRRLRRSRGGGDGNGEKGDEKEDDGEKQKGVEGNLNGGASMNGNDVNTNGNTIRKRKTQQSQSPGEKHEEKGKKWTVDETVDLEKYEYYWEPYPDNGTFWERLDWVMDIFNSFRGAGWNYSISSIPSLQPPVITPLPTSILSSSSSSSSPSSPSSSQGHILPHFPHGLPVTFTPSSSPPLSTRQHFHRPLTTRSFLLSRLIHITWSYLALDFFTVSARLDPYFLLGPNGPLRHPDHLSSLASSSPSVLPPLSLACARFLASLPLWGLDFARSLFSLSGVLGGLFLYSCVWQLTQFFVLGGLLGNESQGMDELWRYPSLFGGFVRNVLDRGLAGFWGGWWHQSFRVGFTGPIRFLVKIGVFGKLDLEEDENGGKVGEGTGAVKGGKNPNEKQKRTGKKRAVAMLEMATAFLLSGVLHALGGWTSTAFRISPEGEDRLTCETRNRLAVFAEPVGFFVSQFAGCLVQAFLIVLLKRVTNGRVLPRWLKRTGNGLFVLMWLHWTRWMLIDDMSRSGLFLFEPVPVSVFRWLGLGGMPGEGRGDWWRLDGEYLPSLWKGERWWQSGIRI